MTPEGQAQVLGDSASPAVTVEVAADAMSARVTGFRPAAAGAPALSVEDILAALEAAGAVACFDHDMIAQAVIKAQGGEDLTGLVLARGEPPADSCDAELKALGDITNPVFSGDLIGRIIPAVQPTVGQNVRGVDLLPRRPVRPRELRVPPGSGLRFNEASGELTAERYGLVCQDGEEVRLLPLLRASKDRLRLTADIYATDFFGRPVTAARLAELLGAMHVSVPLDRDAVEKTLAAARTGDGVVRGVIVARGIAPLNGEDGRFDSPYQLKLCAGATDEHGRVDYYERGLIRSVNAGDVLGRLVRAKKGVPGRDIYGNMIAAMDGRETDIVPGEGVEVKPDTNEFLATMDGMVVFTGNRLFVSETCEIAGDVNFATGNVRMDKGSVLIRGSICDGFTVQSAGNVSVEGSIESATVLAVGDVIVRGGVAGKGGGVVKAGGSVVAAYLSNVRVEAGGDILVNGEVVNCQLTAGGRIRASGSRGKIMGGAVRAELGLEAADVGSHLGVVSTVSVGTPPERDEELVAARRALKQTIEKIDAGLGHEDPRKLLERTSPEKRKVLVKIIEARITARRQLEEVEKAIAEDEIRRRSSMRAKVRVPGSIHAGTKVLLYEQPFTVTDELKGAVIFFDHEQGRPVAGRPG